MKKKIKQFMVMVMVGATGVVIQLTMYNIFRMLLSPLWAAQLAVFFAIMNNFYLHGRVTFAQKGFSLRSFASRQGYIFLGYSLLMVIAQGQWLHWLITWFPASQWVENGYMFLGMIWGSVLNYLVYSKWIWPSKTKAQN